MEKVGILSGNFLPFGIFYGHSVYFPPFLVYCVMKNLATLQDDEKILASCKWALREKTV
jgi:hypothetical protein